MRKSCVIGVIAMGLVWTVGCGDDESCRKESDSFVETDWGDSDTQTENETNDTASAEDTGVDTTDCQSDDALCQPGQTILCDEVGPEYTDQATAECLSDCSGWDVSACEEAKKVEIYGNVDVALQCDFVVDVAKIDDVDYQDAHLEELIFSEPAFSGNIAGVAFPSDEVDDYYEILAMRSPTADGAELVIVQQGFDAQGRLVNPVVELRLPSVAMESGMDLEVCQGAGVVFYVYDLTPEFQIDCFHAVSGDDEMHVDVAEGLGQPDGGRLHLTGQDIALYYLADTPHGDLTDQLSYPACERLD